MAYSELIKNFEGIRDYMRQFYVYGFKSRAEYHRKSARSYDNERRRVESWLGDYMTFRQEPGGKQVFLSVDSRAIEHNPLHQAFRAKSFTDRDITLHFYILDQLRPGKSMTVAELLAGIDAEYLCRFPGTEVLDVSTLRKKLKEYEQLGLVQSQKQGRELLWSRTESPVHLESWHDALDFYAEDAPLGVVGSYLLDRLPPRDSFFRFKHHYLLHALDSQILCTLLEAIRQRRCVTLTARSPRADRESIHTVCPMNIHISAQTGRQYLLAYHSRHRQFRFFRLDAIHAVALGETEPEYAARADLCEKFTRNLWGVSTGSGGPLEHIEMTVRAEDWEPYILRRLQREKRHGTVEILDKNTCRFTADVYDAEEMLPWLRTFIGRIVQLECSNPRVTQRFYEDLAEMRAMYGGD